MIKEIDITNIISGFIFVMFGLIISKALIHFDFLFLFYL